MKYAKAILIGVILSLVLSLVLFFSIGKIGAIVTEKNCSGYVDPNAYCFCQGYQLTLKQNKYCTGSWQLRFSKP